MLCENETAIVKKSDHHGVPSMNKELKLIIEALRVSKCSPCNSKYTVYIHEIIATNITKGRFKWLDCKDSRYKHIA